MNIGQLIEELEKLPKDKLLYDSINQPNWYTGPGNSVVLAGSPCPIQTVEHLLHKLKLIMKRDYPSQDLSFRRVIYDDTEIYFMTAKEDRGLYQLMAESITSSTLKNWQMHSTDSMMVDVAIGGPSYLMSSDKVKILVNKSYYNALGITGKRLYLEELLSVHAFSWQDTRTGEIQYMNKTYWDNVRNCCNDEDKLKLNVTKGFKTVSLKGKKRDNCGG